jgi:hypothetical protein
MSVGLTELIRKRSRRLGWNWGENFIDRPKGGQ